MSVDVSYKKQSLFGILYLLVILIIIEGAIHVLEINQNENCLFIESDVYENIEKEQLIEMCKNYREVRSEYNEYLQLIPDQSSKNVNINNFGFRGPDIEFQKPENVYRIFMVGGSTIFGSGSTNDATTIPGFLQQKFNTSELDYDIEVINAGYPGAYSKTEVLLVEDIILDLDPNLIIVYDGWNDVHIPYTSHIDKRNVQGNLYDAVNEIKKILPFYKTPTFLRTHVMNIMNTDSEPITSDDDLKNKISLWSERWDDICHKNHDKNIDILITVQPLLGSGKKQLSISEQEIFNSVTYPVSEALSMKKYVDQFSEFQNCTYLVDFTNSFDNNTETIFFDRGHIGDNGNYIIAENFYEVILPIINENIK